MGSRRHEGLAETALNGRDCEHALFGVAGPSCLRGPSAAQGGRTFDMRPETTTFEEEQ